MTTFVYMNGHLTDIIVEPGRHGPPSRTPPPLPRLPRSPRAPPPRSRSWSHDEQYGAHGAHGAGMGVAHYLHPLVVHRPRPHPLPRPHAQHARPRRALRLQIQLHRPLARRARRKVQRLVKYEQERWQDFQRLAAVNQDVAQEAPHAPTHAATHAARGPHQANGDLDRVQSMFPHDSLHLYDENPLAAKLKGLVLRSKSSPASKLSRALSTKSVGRLLPDDAPPGGPGGPGVAGGPGGMSSVGDALVNGELPKPVPKLRQFIMEAPTQFTTGVQGQERHLFLFSDVLLVAKPRGPGHFKLKDKVRVASLWLTAEPAAIQEVCEVDKSPETSFVLGWPTSNVVATFSTQAARDLWWTKLNEVMAAEADHEPKSTNIQVVFYDVDTNIEYCKTLCVRPSDTVQRCIQLALEHLEMQSLDPQQFQLWAKTPGDESPYPLVGHERPFAIRMSCLRDHMNQEEGFDLDHCNNMYEPLNPRQRCQFILRNVRQMADPKKKPKNRKSPMRLRQVFKRTKSELAVDAVAGDDQDQAKKGKKNKSVKQRRSNSGGVDTTDGSPAGLASLEDAKQGPQGDLFGVPLQQLWRECHADCEDAELAAHASHPGELAKPIMSLLGHVFAHGIATQGIFRRSANQRAVRELRRALDLAEGDAADGGEEGVIAKCSVLTTSCLLKEFLRSLPVPLLVPDLCAEWLAAHHAPQHVKLQRYAAVLGALPRCHRGLLAYLLCVLHHVAANQDHNLMSPSNLGVVLAPSLLRAPAAPAHASALPPRELEQVLTATTPAMVAFLIVHCQQLFGPAVTRLLGEPPPPQDSGAEESDSLHSGGLDSLEHLEPLEPSPPPRKDKMSLSRDSGLTMSDSQLFTPDEEESGSTSSSGSGRPTAANRYKAGAAAGSVHSAPGATTVSSGMGSGTASGTASGTGSGTGCRQYVRVYGGWEERRQGQAGLYSTCSSPRTAQLPSATSTGTGSSPASSPASTPTSSASPFKREDWFRQRSALRRLASGGAGSPSSPSYSPSHSPGPGSGSGSGSGSGIYGNLPALAAPQTAPSATSTSSLASAGGSTEGRAGRPDAPAAGGPAGPAGPSQRTAPSMRLMNARQDRLRRSASEESLLECRGSRGRQYGQLGQAGHPRLQPRPGGPQVGRPLPPRPQPQCMARSRSAYHLASLGADGLRTYPLEQANQALQQDQDDAYGHARPRPSYEPHYEQPSKAVNANADDSYDSSTLSDDDSTPHVSRSNSRSKEPWSPAQSSSASSATLSVSLSSTQAAPPPPLPPKLRHLPPVHVELGATMERRGRSRRRLPKPAVRSKSLPPPSQMGGLQALQVPVSPPPYRPPPSVPPSTSSSASSSSSSSTVPLGVPVAVPSHRAPITTYYLGARPSARPLARPSARPTSLRPRPAALLPDEGESYV